MYNLIYDNFLILMLTNIVFKAQRLECFVSLLHLVDQAQRRITSPGKNLNQYILANLGSYIVKRASLAVLVALLLSVCPENVRGNSPIFFDPGQPFSFTLKTDAKTSAGVYKKDGTLIRTLWSGVSYKAGSYTKTWDGKDDEGYLYTEGEYDIRILSNNVTASWEGVVGNTSAQFTGPSVHRGMEPIRTMSISGNTVFYAKGYSEGSPAQARFATTDPQTKTSLLPNAGLGQTTLFSATDGINVYWAGYDVYASQADSWFVFATKVADDSEYVFPKGAAYPVTRGYTYKSAIAAMEGVAISGLAVQKSGNFLFIAYEYVNAILVFNKTTGELVKTAPLGDSPRNICVDKDDNLWVILGTNKLRKYTVKTNGSLSVSGSSLTGLSNPQAVAVSPDGATLLVADGGDSQQLKAYSTASGSLSWSYGKKGGYATDATVSTDKFHFKVEDAGRSTYLAFQSDGSFWVGDNGNFRALHFSVSRGYLESVMYVPTTYSSNVDGTNPSRVFAGFLEFSVDYSKPLAGANGSWKLVRNWSINVPGKYQGQFDILRGVATLSNGRTYASLKNATTGGFELVELVSGGLLRLTGQVISPPSEGGTTQLYADGSLRRTYRTTVGQAQKFTQKPLTGFDSNNNPIWGAETTLATTPPATSDDPLYYGNQLKLRSGEVTSSGVVIAFDGSKASTRYHLGGIRLSDNKWLWRTAVNTHPAYTGAYPVDGAYDIGNSVNTTGIAQQVNGRIILWGYHGEFWKGAQTNKYTLVYDNGLFLGTFGTTAYDNGLQGLPTPPVQMAGNAFSGKLVKVGDDLYYYHNDENYHSGVHRWKISGLNTIQEQVVALSRSQPMLAEGVSSGGLTGYYFASPDVNNLTLKTTRVDAQVNFNWGAAVPAGTRLSDSSSYSVRWKGFLQGSYSESYRLSVQAAQGVRLWVNDSLYIDQWSNSSQREFSCTVPLVAGQYVPIRLEVQGGSSIALSWSSRSQPGETIPARALLPSVDDEALTGKDLLLGLGFNKVLEDGLYGWKRDPVAEDYTDRNKVWWQAVSSRKTYRKDAPDLWVKYRQVSGSYAISRDLGSVSNATSWSLTGRISYEDNEGNSATGGCYLEVLDKNEKVIARTYMSINYAGTKPITIFGNSAQIASGPSAQMNQVVDQIQPLSIVGSSSGITFSYANYPSVTTGVFDGSSDWRSPKTMRLYFYSTISSTGTSNRIIDIESMQFSASGSASSRVAAVVEKPLANRLRFYPNPSQDVLTVEHRSIEAKGSLSIISGEGHRVLEQALSVGSAQARVAVSGLPAGVYLLEFVGDSTREVARFIKQ